MSKSLITAPNPQTFVEACDAVRDLEEKVKTSLSAIRQQGKDLIAYRWWQGKITDVALGMDRSDSYGEEVVQTIANRAGVHKSTLYRCLQFYRHISDQGVTGEAQLRKWMDEKEEEKGRITWTYCINWTQKALPESTEAAEEKLEKVIEKLDKKAEKLEHEALDLEEEVQTWNGEKREEAIGAIAKAKEVAEDVRHQAERLKLEKPRRIQDEKYLAFVREFDCLVCSNPSEAHHLVTGGMGSKGPDYTAVPLCRLHHSEYHQIGHGPFAHKFDVDLWRAVANLVTLYFTGIQIDRQD